MKFQIKNLIEGDDLLSHPLRIRLVDQSDLPGLEWDGEYLHFRRMYKQLYQDSRDGNSLLWIAEEPGLGIVGQIFMRLGDRSSGIDPKMDSAYIFGFRVKKQFRNNGYGRLLLQHAERETMKRGFYRSILNVAKDNQPAIEFYKKCGYRVFGSTPGRWSYFDHKGIRRLVDEPSWRLEKILKSNNL